MEDIVKYKVSLIIAIEEQKKDNQVEAIFDKIMTENFSRTDEKLRPTHLKSFPNPKQAKE